MWVTLVNIKALSLDQKEPRVTILTTNRINANVINPTKVLKYPFLFYGLRSGSTCRFFHGLPPALCYDRFNWIDHNAMRSSSSLPLISSKCLVLVQPSLITFLVCTADIWVGSHFLFLIDEIDTLRLDTFSFILYFPYRRKMLCSFIDININKAIG